MGQRMFTFRRRCFYAQSFPLVYFLAPLSSSVIRPTSISALLTSKCSRRVAFCYVANMMLTYRDRIGLYTGCDSAYFLDIPPTGPQQETCHDHSDDLLRCCSGFQGRTSLQYCWLCYAGRRSCCTFEFFCTCELCLKNPLSSRHHVWS